MYLLNHQCVSGTGSLTCACRLYAARRAILIGAGINFRLLENVCHRPKNTLMKSSLVLNFGNLA